MAYDSAKQAYETTGGYIRIVLSIELNDADSNAPTNLTLLDDGSGNLQFGDLYPYPTGSSGEWANQGVESFGLTAQHARIGAAFVSRTDVSITMKNVMVQGQRENSTYTFASGSPAMNPEPLGDEIRLDQLLQFYVLHGSVATLKVLFYSDGQLDPSHTFTPITGVVSGVSFPGDRVVIDIASSVESEDDIIQGREITAPPKDVGKGTRIPIVYGEWRRSNHGLGSETNVSSQQGYDDIVAGFKPPLVPIVPYDKPDTDTYRLVACDFTGKNAGWTDQVSLQFPDNSQNVPMIFHPEIDAVSIMETGTSDGETQIDTAYASDDTERTFTVQKYQNAIAYIPCSRIYQYGGGFTPTNPEYALNRRPHEVFHFPLDNVGDYIDFIISPTAPLGDILRDTDDAIGAYLVGGIVGSSSFYTVSGNPIMYFGLYSISGAEWVGQNGTANATYGSMASSTSHGLKRQEENNSVAIPAESYYQDGATKTREEPLLNWTWHTSAHDGSGNGLNYVVVRMYCAQAGGAGSYYSCSSVGAYVKWNPDFPKQHVRNRSVGRYLPDPTGREGGQERYVDKRLGDLPGLPPRRAYISNYTTLQFGASIDDASGTVTGTGSTSSTPSRILGPAHIIDHLGRAWAQGPPEMVTTTGQFGSSRLAQTEMDDWLNDIFNDHEYWLNPIFDSSESFAACCNRITRQSPLMVHRAPDTKKIYQVTYPENAPATTKSGSGYMRYYDQEDNVVKFHAGIMSSRAERRGQPFGLLRFDVDTTPHDDIYNRFILKYRRFEPTGELIWTQSANETDGESWVSGTTTYGGRPELNPSDISGVIGYSLSDVCASSQSRYKITRTMSVECPDITAHLTATAYLHYLIKRYTNHRMIVTATVGQEAIDLLPGYIIQFCDDCNLLKHRLDYWNQPAKNAGWEELDFMVLSVFHEVSGSQVLVHFTAEQIVYDPS